MNRCEHDNLLGRIHPFKTVKCNIYSASECRLIKYRGPALAFNQFSVGIHSLCSVTEPLTDRSTAIVVVSAHEYHDGINLFSVLLFQLVCLRKDMLPLSAADSIDV